MKSTRDGIGEAGSALPLLKGKGGEGREPAFRGFLMTGASPSGSCCVQGCRRCAAHLQEPPVHRGWLGPEPTPRTAVHSRGSATPRSQPSLRWRGCALAPGRLSAPSGSRSYLLGAAAGAVVVVCDADLLVVLGLQLALVETQGALQDVFDLISKKTIHEKDERVCL